MNWLKKRSFLQLILIFLLPILVFSFYEIGSLRDNEDVIESIYNNQLDAILFSVNQYADNVLSEWADELSGIPLEESENLKERALAYPSILGLVRIESQMNPVFSSFAHDSLKMQLKNLNTLFTPYDTTLTRLKTYLRGNYRKLVAIPSADTAVTLILYALQEDEEVFYDLLLVETVGFVSQVLDPKIQEIARNEFYITVMHSETEEVIYNCDKQYQSNETQYSKAFWLLPRYSLGIEMKNITIAELAKDRSKKDIIVIIIVDIVLIFGLILVQRNQRKEMRLSQLKTDFVSNVSHEIRTPLALISMYIESLEMGRVKTAEKTQEYYRIILQETRRLTTIVNKILSFSQIENDKKRYSLSPATLKPLVEEVYQTFRFNLEQKGFTIELKLDASLPAINIDAESVTDALVNLVDNATKYSNDEKHITITTGTRNNWQYLDVSDRGIGISAEDQELIFDKFFRVTEKNLALRAKGSGLGLTIVKHIIDAHKGKIELESTVGKGTTFRLLFPC